MFVRQQPGKRLPWTRSHVGFSLIELLVVVAIIGVLVAILLPAVQQAREAARRSQCLSNLKQIGLALNNYESVYRQYPKGGAGAASLVSPFIRARWIMSWGSAILPYVEEDSLYNRINTEEPYLFAGNLTAGKSIVRVYLCPSALHDDNFRPNGDTPSSTTRYAITDYSGNWGERGLRCYPQTNCQNNYSDQGDTTGNGRGVMLFTTEQNVKLSSIVDGVAQTIAIGEAPDGIHSIWIGHKNALDQSAPLNFKAAAAVGNSGWPSCGAEFASKNGRFCDHGQEFHSYHAGGAQFLFLDGSAELLSSSIDFKLFAALLSRSGGELAKRTL